MRKVEAQMELLQKKQDELSSQLDAERRRAQLRALARLEKMRAEATVRTRCNACGETFKNSKVLERCPFCWSTDMMEA